jgi:two-component system LytT family response regulator
VTLRVLISDDEPLARERLHLLLGDDPEIQIVCECRDGREVTTALKSHSVDLVLLDIQMPGNTGLEVIEMIGPAAMPITIFVTAHNHYAIKAFEVHALDYLTKPIEPDRLRASIARAKEKLAADAALTLHTQLTDLMLALKKKESTVRAYPQRLLVRNGTKDSFLIISEIEVD